MKIPLYKPEVSRADIAAVLSVLRSGWISHRGPAVERFEKAFARAVGARYAVAVSSGTAALHCALVAAGVKPGDVVTIPALTYVATANAVRHAGAIPKFVDVDGETWVAPHADVGVPLYGHPAAASRIWDMAEALGSKVRLTAAWSFFANKHITCGEGGMVTTDSVDVAAQARSFSHQGVTPDFDEYAPPQLGWNYRMTAMQAALGLSQLRRLPAILKKKRAIAGWYREELSDYLSFQADHPGHAHWLVSARVGWRRDELRAWLLQRGIETRPVFPSLDPVCPVACMIASSGISFPSWPGLSREQVRYVCETVREFYR